MKLRLKDYEHNMKTGFLYESIFLEHQTGPGHPESPQRLSQTLEYLGNQPLFQNTFRVPARKAQTPWLLGIHSADYLKRAEITCLEGGPFLDTSDAPVGIRSFEAALWACGGAMALADAVMDKKIENGFGLLRPPGHHAERGFAMGFCLINNIAVTARYLQKKYGLEKIFILDWDVHHGNGTQHSFEEDPSVFYASLHQFPFYPGTGAYWETGIGKGSGFTLNCPMKAGSTDEDYQNAFSEKIIPAIESYKPQIILISAGFDAHEDDPLADIRLSTGFYGWMTKTVMAMAEKYCDRKIISLLEGGYNLKALGQCVETHLKALSD